MTDDKLFDDNLVFFEGWQQGNVAKPFDSQALLRSIYEYANRFAEGRAAPIYQPTYVLPRETIEFVAKDMGIPAEKLTSEDIDRFVAKYLFE